MLSYATCYLIIVSLSRSHWESPSLELLDIILGAFLLPWRHCSFMTSTQKTPLMGFALCFTVRSLVCRELLCRSRLLTALPSWITLQFPCISFSSMAFDLFLLTRVALGSPVLSSKAPSCRRLSTQISQLLTKICMKFSLRLCICAGRSTFSCTITQMHFRQRAVVFLFDSFLWLCLWVWNMCDRWSQPSDTAWETK